MKTKTYWLVFAGFFLLAFFPAMLWGSTTLTNLEHKIIDESQNRITTIIHSEFGDYGLAVMGKDQTGGGKIFVLVHVPGMDRYWTSEIRNYTANQNYKFGAKDLNHWALLHLDHGVISDENTKSGFGYLGSVFMRILVAAAIASIGALIIDTRIRRRKKQADTQAP